MLMGFFMCLCGCTAALVIVIMWAACDMACRYGKFFNELDEDDD